MRMVRRIIGAAVGAALILSLTASVAFAGEITGNGKSLKVDGGGKWGTGLHARSFCAFSGQEDLQYLDEEGNPLPVAHKGVPGHAQSWGQIPKVFRVFLTSVGSNPGIACNPQKATGPG
jgi:hypothetical protein